MLEFSFWLFFNFFIILLSAFIDYVWRWRFMFVHVIISYFDLKCCHSLKVVHREAEPQINVHFAPGMIASRVVFLFVEWIPTPKLQNKPKVMKRNEYM